MKQLNWQTKALTLFITLAALWLATACAGRGFTYHDYPADGLRFVRWESCEIDVPLVPSREIAKLAERWKEQNGTDPSVADLRGHSEFWAASRARDTRLAPQIQRILDVIEPYRSPGGWFEEYPYFEGAQVEALYTWDGIPTDKIVVVVNLSHLVDPRTVRPEHRIPGCIAGVPVHFEVGFISGWID